jgi:hypothetical protein
VELSPAFLVRADALSAQGEMPRNGFRKGVKWMKIATSEAVVPMVAVHKVG